ncbi:MAG: GNAT family N-acetyltransferase [Acidobacteriia bacterium]|nr:GNAT family N-acetyltransferase [Terriglobia bacterium]
MDSNTRNNTLTPMSKIHVSIRPIEKSDFETLCEIDQACFPPGVAYSTWEMRWFLTRRGAFGFLAEVGDKENLPPGGSPIAGFIVAWKVQGKAGHIITLDILERYRRLHIGSNLMKKVEEEFRKAEIRVALLEVSVNNTAAQEFYKGFGYKVNERLKNYYPTGEDALEMARWFEE